MIKEVITLEGRLGTLPKEDKENKYIYFNINTSSIENPRWWRIIVYNKELLETMKNTTVGIRIKIVGQPEFYAWTKLNKKGNTVLSKDEIENQMKASIFVRRTCITDIDKITFI